MSRLSSAESPSLPRPIATPPLRRRFTSDGVASTCRMHRANRRSPIKRNVKRKILPVGGTPIFFLGIQPNRLNVHSESGLPQVLRPRLVSAGQAKNQLLCPVVPFRCCDGTHRF